MPERFLEAAGSFISSLSSNTPIAASPISRAKTAMLTRYFQAPEGELEKKKVADPRAAVAIDVALLRAIPALPGEWLVSGLVYDVGTGLVEIVVPPARIRTVTTEAAAAGATKAQ